MAEFRPSYEIFDAFIGSSSKQTMPPELVRRWWTFFERRMSNGAHSATSTRGGSTGSGNGNDNATSKKRKLEYFQEQAADIKKMKLRLEQESSAWDAYFKRNGPFVSTPTPSKRGRRTTVGGQTHLSSPLPEISITPNRDSIGSVNSSSTGSSSSSSTSNFTSSDSSLALSGSSESGLEGGEGQARVSVGGGDRRVSGRLSLGRFSGSNSFNSPEDESPEAFMRTLSQFLPLCLRSAGQKSTQVQALVRLLEQFFPLAKSALEKESGQLSDVYQIVRRKSKAL